jgi:hypothetical protein
LVAAIEAVAEAVGSHDSLSKAAEAARGAVARMEQAHEVAEEALTEARRTAREYATQALAAGRAPGPLDLSKVRGEVEKAADALLAARGALEELEAKQEAARRALARAQAQADAAAIATVGAERVPALLARMTGLAAEFPRDMAQLEWLVAHHVVSDPAVPELLKLRDLALRHWPQAREAIFAAAALDRAVVALVNDPAVGIPPP